ncbi:hypothetical protein E2C01_019167 [Portunus trituberculatus]|uniref:Uncharacterized protein n=1 Tax=Portunus trituberculatus TaxID=210409 RepID=A0A5B7DY48_PORTR|nr:hypothetical protein [Portunus trituberculatus]
MLRQTFLAKVTLCGSADGAVGSVEQTKKSYSEMRSTATFTIRTAITTTTIKATSIIATFDSSSHVNGSGNAYRYAVLAAGRPQPLDDHSRHSRHC